MLGAENNLIVRKYPRRGHHGPVASHHAIPKHPREDWPQELGALKIWEVGFPEPQGLDLKAGNPSQSIPPRLPWLCACGAPRPRSSRGSRASSHPPQPRP